MVTDRVQVLADPQHFEEYYRRVSDRLRTEYDERVAFLRRSAERLDGLLVQARGVHDYELEQELSTQLDAARAELALLERTGGTALPVPEEQPALPAGVPSPAPFQWAVGSWSVPGSRPDEPADTAELPPDRLASEELLPPAREAPPALEAPPPADPGSPADVPEWVQSLWSTPAATAAAPPAAAPFDWDLGFRGTPAAGSAPELPSPQSSPKSPTRPAFAGSLRLHVDIGGHGFEWTMPADTALLGRRDPVTRRSPDLDCWPDTAVSRRHARISGRDGRYFLEDLGSTNGTEVNRAALSPGSETELRPGDVILIGEHTRIEVR
jgi:hypothetical protein